MKSTATSPPSRSCEARVLCCLGFEDLVVAGLRVVQVSIGFVTPASLGSGISESALGFSLFLTFTLSQALNPLKP